MRRTATVLLAALALLAPRPASSCTNILVTRGASADGSTLITYAADSHNFYGELASSPGGVFAPGATRDIHEWDTGRYLGRIPQAPRTFRVVGNMNERQVAIGETTFGGRDSLRDSTGVLDYGSLIYIALERAATAREAIRVMTSLVAEHGYYSTGESFSVSDPNEAWLMELIGKGRAEKGAVWVARRVPDGYVSGHANHPRIRQFPLHDPADCLYSPDVITFARKKGWYSGKDEDFSFADTYAPLNAGKLRSCEGRVWSVFRRAAPSAGLTPDMVDGSTLEKRLPLWVKPDRKLSVHDVMELMRDHYEGTPFDMTVGLAPGPYGLPNRWRPNEFTVDSVKYRGERPISTQQTGFSFVAQSRAGLPDLVGGVLWFGVDDTYTTVYVPFYCGIDRVPRSWAAGTADFGAFDRQSAFWTFNFVANWAYSRYMDMIVDIQSVQRELEGGFLARQPEVEAAALALHRQAPQLARDYLTDYCEREGERVAARWRTLGDFLVWKYMDGNVRDAQGHPGQSKAREAWYRAVAREDGARLLRTEPPKPATAATTR